MPWRDVFWNDIIAEHIALHGLTRADVENAVCNATTEEESDSTGRPVLFGFAIDGRKIAVVYEVVDRITVIPITAYEVK
ncbi:MAG TPA: hypothetical protein VF595_09680 [Tepidisphaeraceae bacterium]|jgi:hypothetical protein